MRDKDECIARFLQVNPLCIVECSPYSLLLFTSISFISTFKTFKVRLMSFWSLKLSHSF